MSHTMEEIRIGLALEQDQVPTGAARSLYGMVSLEAPRYVPAVRPPLDLVACIDVSGSMSGRKLQEAREAVKRLVENLDDQDRLALVAFTDDASLLAQLTPADRSGRRQLSDKAGALEALGSTNMGEGARLSLEQLRGEPREVGGKPALRRALVFTDGHANVGLDERDRAGWTRLFREHLGTASVSWFGFGEDHDAHFLSALADETRGNAYVAKDADAIGTAFAQELGSLIGTVARDLRIAIRTRGAVPVVLNDEKQERDGDAVVVHLPDLTSQEKRDLVFEWPLPPGPLGEALEAASAELTWTDVRTQSPGSARLSVAVRYVGPGESVPRNTRVLESVAEQRGANAQKIAAGHVEKGDAQRARAVLEEAARFARGIGTPAAEALARRLEGLAGEYADYHHYMAHRSDLKALHRTSSKRRSSGSRIDGETLSDLQAAMMAAFKPEPPDPQAPQAAAQPAQPPPPRPARPRRPRTS